MIEMVTQLVLSSCLLILSLTHDEQMLDIKLA